MRKVLVVSNYNAGRKQAVMHKKTLHKFLLHNCDSFKFISIDEFNDINLEEYDVIFATGGDGTVSKVVPSLINTDKTLGIIPCGTANLLSASLGLSMNLKKTLKIIKKGNTKQIDVININDKYCALRCGFGYDADIICKTPQSLKNKFGYFAYFIAGILFALRLKLKNYELTYDGKDFEYNASCVIVANSPNMYRNFISVGKNSKLNDEKFEVFILKTQNPILFFIEFMRIILGIKKDNKLAQYFQTNSLSLKNHWTVCHIDGEKVNLKGNIQINMQNGAIRVFSK